MKKSWLLLLWSCLLLLQPAGAQVQVIIIDQGQNVATWAEQLEMEPLFQEQRSVYQGLLEQGLTQFIESNSRLQKELEKSCGTYELERKLTETLKLQQNTLQAIESYLLDTISHFEEKLLLEIGDRIWGKIQQRNLSDPQQLSVFKAEVLYQESGYPTDNAVLPLEDADRQSLQAQLDAAKVDMIIAYTHYFAQLEELAERSNAWLPAGK